METIARVEASDSEYALDPTPQGLQVHVWDRINWPALRNLLDLLVTACGLSGLATTETRLVTLRFVLTASGTSTFRANPDGPAHQARN